MMPYVISSYTNLDPYVPATLSEIYDLLGSMMLGAPKFHSNWEPGDNVDSIFTMLTAGLDRVRPKLGEERYAALMRIAAEAKVLFAADPEDSTGETQKGRALLQEIEDMIQDARRRRVKDKLPDHEGEVTGD